MHQKRLSGGVYRWTELDLFSQDPYRWVTACTWKCTLMADDYVSISFISHEYVSFAVGDWCIINGRFYSIRSMSDVTRKGESVWDYNVVMYGVTYDLIKCLFRNCDMYGRSSTCHFDLTYTLEEFIKVVVYNMNRKLPAHQLPCRPAGHLQEVRLRVPHHAAHGRQSSGEDHHRRGV